MDDKTIVELYWQRREVAIRETDDRYGDYLQVVANRILADREESRESVNDTYLKAWNSMPPHRPANLRTYLYRITRQTAIDRLRRRQAQKRFGSEYLLSLEELEECVAGTDNPQEELDKRALSAAIGAFLRTLEPTDRQVFVRRYAYFEPLREIAAAQGESISAIKSRLHRLRVRLRTYLEKEGFTL